MQRHSLDIEGALPVVEIEMHGVVAAVLAISLFRRRQNLSCALKAWHQQSGRNFLQRADDSPGAAFYVAEAAERTVNSKGLSG